MRISMIAVLGARTRVIGAHNDLVWKGLGPDIERFKMLTVDHPVIMGRKTWDSLPARFRPLPKRTNIVVSRAPKLQLEGSVTAISIDAAIREACRSPGSEEIFIIGGGMIYDEAIEYTDRLYLTLVDDDTPGDSYFPTYKNEFPRVLSRVEIDFNPPLTFLTLER